ncbi:MAG: hypothetical protein MUO52_05405 [Desulfobacterales bacterium]|nr:hypothetical protein [Desulfobacterales bacterium]
MRNKRKQAAKDKELSGGSAPSYWMIIAVIAISLSLGLMAKIIFFPSRAPSNAETAYQISAVQNDSVDTLVQLVASEFRCACGGCGELPLVECECDMVRGAKEEKGFIRKKLNEGLPVEKVIQLMEEVYGHRST